MRQNASGRSSKKYRRACTRRNKKMVVLSARIQKLEQVIESGTVSRTGPAVDIDSPDLDRLREGEQYPKGDPGENPVQEGLLEKSPIKSLSCAFKHAAPEKRIIPKPARTRQVLLYIPRDKPLIVRFRVICPGGPVTALLRTACPEEVQAHHSNPGKSPMWSTMYRWPQRWYITATSWYETRLIGGRDLLEKDDRP